MHARSVLMPAASAGLKRVGRKRVTWHGFLRSVMQE